MIRSVNRKIYEGKWKGAYLTPKHNRGIVKIRTKMSGDAQVTIMAYHAVLISHGHYPTNQRRVCSHLCHNPLCVNVDHLQWSDANDNMLREYCRSNKVCSCGLKRRCRFDCLLG